MNTLTLYTGLSPQEIKNDLEDKKSILKQLVKNNVTDVHKLGLFFAKYYTGRLMIKV